jgi:hypothetical protein
MARMGQYYQQPYPYGYAQYSPYGYQQPVYTAIAPQTYNEQYYSYWLQPIDQSEMPDTPIPGFQGMGQLLSGVPKWALIAGAAGLVYFFVLRKK